MDMKRRTKQEWEQVFAQQEQSGLSQRTFCEQAGVSYHGFRSAKGRCLKDKGRVGDLIESKVATGPSTVQAVANGFLEIEVLADELEPQGLSRAAVSTPEDTRGGSINQQELEVQLPFGVVLRFRGMNS